MVGAAWACDMAGVALRGLVGGRLAAAVVRFGPRCGVRVAGPGCWPAGFGVAEIGGVAVLGVGRVGAAGLGRRERVDRVEGLLEGVGVRVAGGEPEDDPAAGADDPGGDVEQDPSEGVGVTAQRCALVGRVA